MVRRVLDIDFAGEGGVEVVDVDATIFAAGIDVSRVGAAGRREVATDQSLQDVMSAERDQRAVVRVGAVVFVAVGHEAVVEAGRKAVGVDTVKLLRRHHLAQIPEFHHLVFAIAQDVTAVAFAVDVRQAFGVAHEDTRFPTVAHTSAIPDLDGRIVGAGVENVWRGYVAETDSIDVVLVCGDPEDRFSCLNVVDVYRSIRGASHDFTSVAGEAYGPYLVDVSI